MQSFFNDSSTIQHGELVNPNWIYAKAGLLANIKKVVDFYHQSEMAVKSQHFLVNLLLSIGIDQKLDLERYYDAVDTKGLGIGRSFHMTSSLSYGGIFNGVFYGPKSKEVLIAINDSFDPFWVDKHWKNVCAIRPLLITQSDLSMALPDGKNKSTSEGLSVIAINIPMLAVQYRAFCIEQAKNEYNKADTLSPGHFVHMFVLPNMLLEQTNMALFNRFNNLLLGAPMSETAAKHPFFLIDYSKFVDRFYNIVIKYLDKSDRNFNTILSLVPMLNGNLKTVLRLPDFAPTRQVWWAEVLSRLDAVEFLTNIAPNGGTKLNHSDVNYFLREFNMLENNNIFNSAPMEIREDAEIKISNIRNKTK